MVTFSIEPGRLRRASTQPFRLMKSTVNTIFIVLGSTGNAYVVAVSKESISCNCPDSHPVCKHIVFLLHLSGCSGRRQLTFSPSNLVKKLHAEPPNPKLKKALLDQHTNQLCSAHIYPHCYFCNRAQSGTLSICSSCGFLSHEHCLQLFLAEENDSGSHCPRCGKLSSRLPSEFIGRHRNFFHVLRHRGYACLPPTSTATHSLNNNNHDDNCQNPNHQHARNQGRVVAQHSNNNNNDDNCLNPNHQHARNQRRVVAQQNTHGEHHPFTARLLNEHDSANDSRLVSSSQMPQDL